MAPCASQARRGKKLVRVRWVVTADYKWDSSRLVVLNPTAETQAFQYDGNGGISIMKYSIYMYAVFALVSLKLHSLLPLANARLNARQAQTRQKPGMRVGLNLREDYLHASLLICTDIPAPAEMDIS